MAMFIHSSYQFFHIDEESYIENVANLTTVAHLGEFFDAQCAIYVDNVYGVYERFFHRLLTELPRSARTRQIKQVLSLIETLLDVDDLQKKMQLFEQFLKLHHHNFENLFEFDVQETRLTAEDFNDVYVRSNVEEVLNYANNTQMIEFVHHTGQGIRIFLVLQRTSLNKTQLYEFKAIVDEFLEQETFSAKRNALQAFLAKCNEFLD